VGRDKGKRAGGEVSMLVQCGSSILRRHAENVSGSLVELLLLGHDGRERVGLVLLGVRKDCGGVRKWERACLDGMSCGRELRLWGG
jgi:hypothetical protein